MYPTRHRRAVPAVALGLLVALSMALALTGCGPRSPEGLYEQAVAKAKHTAEEQGRKFDPASVKSGTTIYQIEGTGAQLLN